MATRRASTRVSNGSSSSSTHQSPEGPSTTQNEKRRAPPSFPALDATEEEVFGTKKMRRTASHDPPIELLQSSSQSSQPPNPPSTSTAQSPPPPPATKPKAKPKGKAKRGPKLSFIPPPPVPSSQTPPSPSSQPLPPAQSTSSTSRGLMLPPPAASRKPARGRPSQVAKAARDPDEDEEGSGGGAAAAGPSVAKKPRSVKGKSAAGSVGREEEVEVGLEGGRLMDEMAEEQVKRSKVVGHGAPAFEILSFAPPKPKSSSKPFSLPAPPKPSTSHGHIADVSAGDSTVPIQISDTPMIRKNQEMRKNVSKRNSFSQRGARASASFGKGEATTPHPQVDTSSFYKHIDGEEPEAIRMRHLLVFVGKRVASTLASTGSVDGSSGPPPDVKGKGKAKAQASSSSSRTKDGEIIAAEVMEDVLRMLVKAKVDTNPQSSGSQPFSLPKKPTLPHPGNVQNRKVEAEGERFIKKGRAEEALWSAAVKSANALQTRTCDAIVKKVTSSDWADSLLDDLVDPADAQAAELAKLVLGREGGAEVPEDLEFSIHTMQQITQTAVQVSNESTRLMDSLFASLTQTLRDRDSAGQTSSSHTLLSSSSNSGPGPSSLLNLPSATSSSSASSFSDPMATLRALANRAAAHPKQETLRAAAALSALGPSGTSSSSSGSSLNPPTTPRRSALPPTTPRRATGTTPFRSGRTPGPAE